ncbi:hypothetical protein HAX54_052159 [Datura stramonium]|uniref:Uncharacterized protein n=1 Tax=Datura stramonium TaxID=4076 RepID=A0ABS8SYJ6_DATST|nr:hypothetical protein [Datura stramonium]
MAPPDVIDVAYRPIRAAERTPTLRRKKLFPKVKILNFRVDFTAFILKGKRKPRTSTSLMTTKKIFPNSGPPFVKIIDQGLASLSSSQPIQGFARFLSATSGLCSGRHSYVLLLSPYLRTQRSPLDVVVTLWLRRLPQSRFMDGFSQRKSLQLNQYQQDVVTD